MGGMVLKKPFSPDKRKFLGPLMRFARGDLRDHIISGKNDHRLAYRRYEALQRQRRPKMNFREILGASQFSTFSTVSAQNRHADAVAACLLLGDERTSLGCGSRSEFDPERMFDASA
jgi:hypothetical protein